jgi:hypothetical protein
MGKIAVYMGKDVNLSGDPDGPGGLAPVLGQSYLFRGNNLFRCPSQWYYEQYLQSPNTPDDYFNFGSYATNQYLLGGDTAGFDALNDRYCQYNFLDFAPATRILVTENWGTYNDRVKGSGKATAPQSGTFPNLPANLGGDRCWPSHGSGNPRTMINVLWLDYHATTEPFEEVGVARHSTDPNPNATDVTRNLYWNRTKDQIPKW